MPGDERVSEVTIDSRAATIRAHIAIVEKLLPRLPDRGAVLYYLAALNQQLGETQRAAELLKQCLQLREGFDPSHSPLFAELMRGSRDFDAMIARLHREFPAVSRAQPAYETVERDLVVEGLAYDAQQDSFYLSSLNRRKIVRISAAGTQSDFVPAGRDNLLPILGVRVDGRDDTVWANSSSEDVSQSELLHFDSLGNLLGRNAINDGLKHAFNDLVVRDDGRVILTDSVSNQVLQFDPDAKTFIPLVVHRYLAEPNGIALADDGSELFVADDFGIVRIDLRYGVSADVDPGPHNTLAGIDGLVDRDRFVGLPPAQFHQRLVDRDPDNPGIELRVALELVQVLIGLHESFLQHVFGVSRTAGDAMRRAKHTVGMRSEERFQLRRLGIGGFCGH
jgi:hypothetical protein